MNKIYLSVIIPCYNEKENLQRGALKEVSDYLEKQKYSWEVIISDDGSSDNSLEIVSDFVKKHKGFTVLKNEHGGKPWALWQGIKKANGEYLLFTDMDQSTPINQLDKLLPWVEKGWQVVIGSRGMERENFPLFRKVGAIVFRIFRGLLVIPGINDTQCGFKLFKREAVKKVFPQLGVLGEKATGWTVTSYDVELLFLLDQLDLKIKEVVVDWQDRDVSTGKGGNYLARYFKESKDMAKQVLTIKLNHWRGKYDLH